MKNLLLLTIAILLTTMSVFAPPNLNDLAVNDKLIMSTRYIDKYNSNEALFRAVCYVETRNNPEKINHKEQAYGIAQVRQIRLDDYFNNTGIRYSLTEMLDTIKAKEVFMFYADRYDQETAARRWNGYGPMTTTYWNLVKKHLK